jgi:Uma2 family endonuclease
MGAIAKIPVRMTVAEFLAWDAGDGRLWQLVDGEPRAMAPASRTHGALQNELGSLIRNHLSERSSLCNALANPGVVPRVQAEHNVRIPNLAVICSEYARSVWGGRRGRPCRAPGGLDRLAAALSAGGEFLMPLDNYGVASSLG